MMTQEPATIVSSGLPLALLEEKTPTATKEPQARGPGIEAMLDGQFPIAGDAIARAVKDLPEDEKAEIKWLAGYLRDAKLAPAQWDGLLFIPNRRSKTAYSKDSIYQLLTGRRAADGVNIAPMIQAIKIFRKGVVSPSRAGDGFVVTRMATDLSARFEEARRLRRILFVFGPSHIGKTEAAVWHERGHNHGATVLVEAPAGGSATAFFDALRKKLHLGQIHRAGDLRQRIIDCFDPTMLLVVDEAHAFLRGKVGLLALDFIRQLYNKAGCGVVLLMTDEGQEHFLGNGARQRPFYVRLKQLWNRRLNPPQLLPAVPAADDLALFAAAYGLEPATDRKIRLETTGAGGKPLSFEESPLAVQNRVCREDSLGIWLGLLREARDLARKQSKPISWGAVLKAYCAGIANAEVWS